MRNRDWCAVHPTPEVSATEVRNGIGDVAHRVTIAGREFSIQITPTAAEQLGERLIACAKQTRALREQHRKDTTTK